MRYTKYTKQNTTQKTKDWETQSTLNKILHRKLKIEIHKVHLTKYYTENKRLRYTKYTKQNTTQKTKDWETQSTLNKILHRKLKIEIHKVH